MKALARLCAVFITALPVPQWVVVVGLALMALAFAATVVSPIFPKASVLPAALGAAFVLMCTVFATGYVFRSLAAPRPHRLVPHFRATLLAATIVIVALAALVWLAFWARWIDPFAGRGVSLAGSFVIAFATLSVAVWLMFFFTGGPLRMLGTAVIGFSLAPLMRMIHAPAEIPIDVLVVSTVVGWLAFGTWYMHARRIRSVIWLTPSRPLERFDARRPLLAKLETRANAVRILLTGRTDQGVRDRLVSLLAAIALVALVVWFARGRAQNDAVIIATMSLTGAFSAAIVGLRAASGARRLWLRGARSRLQLFGTCEREMLLAAATFVVVFATPTALVMLQTNEDWQAHMRALVPFGVSVFLGGYVGLASVRCVGPVGWLAVVVLVVAGLAAVYVAASRLDFAVPLSGGIVAVQVACAAGYRMLARHRWRTIDWLGFRPPLPALFGRRAGQRREPA